MDELIEYVGVAYSEADLSNLMLPIAVVTRSAIAPNRLTVYGRVDLEKIIGDDTNERMYEIASLYLYLRSTMKLATAGEIFRGLHQLHFGPIRTCLSGSCLSSVLNERLSSELHTKNLMSEWPADFASLV